MRRTSILLFALFAVWGMSITAHAVPYTGADITLDGAGYALAGAGWSTVGTAIRTPWGNRWVEYEVQLSAGNWNIGVNAINDDRTNSGDAIKDSVYTGFQISTDWTNDLILIDASDNEVNHGFVNVGIASDGLYTLKLTWLNDSNSYLMQDNPPWDANIQINSVFFDDTNTPKRVLFDDTDSPVPTPEPGTIFLLGSGLVGLAGYARKSRS